MMLCMLCLLNKKFIHLKYVGNFDMICFISHNVVKYVFRRREKQRDPTQPYDKSPYTHRKIQSAALQHKNATQNFDYTTIAGRIRTVSWSNDSHPTAVVKPVNGIKTSFLLTTIVVLTRAQPCMQILFKSELKVENILVYIVSKETSVEKSISGIITLLDRKKTHYIMFILKFL